MSRGIKSLGVAAVVGCAVAAGWVGAQSVPLPKPAEFAYRAPLEGVTPGTGWLRVNVPAQALMLLQSGDGRDIRVFNGDGQAVPFAFTSAVAEAAPEQRTGSYAAYPLFSASGSGKPDKGAMQVRVQGAGGASVWVQMDGASTTTAAAPAGATPLPSALFDTRKEKLPVKALTVQATMPPNTPVRVSASTSADLATWTPLPLRGRLFSFEGAGAMSNQVLELEQPVSLEGKYLRLDWDGQNGVNVSAVSGVVASTVVAPRVTAELAGGVAVGGNGIEWPLVGAAPLRTLSITTTQANTVLPVRILGRAGANDAWAQLGQTVVYRLPAVNAGAAGGSGESTNPPVEIADIRTLPATGTPARSLRIETLNGEPISLQTLKVNVELNPVQLVFVAAGNPPYELAVGRVGTLSAAMAPDVVAATLPKNLNDLRDAKVGTAVVSKIEAPSGSNRTLILWLVLGGGVVILGGVALALFNQLNGSAPKA